MFLILTFINDFSIHQVLKDWHGIVDRHHLMLEACELNSVSEKDYFDLEMAGLGKCLLEGLPDWAIAYTARLVCSLLLRFSLILILKSTIIYFAVAFASLEGEVHKL